MFIRKILPAPTIIRRTTALGIAGCGRAARILNLTGKEMLQELSAYLGPPDIPVKMMGLRMAKDGKVSPMNLYFSFKDRKMEEAETAHASSLQHAGKNYVLDRMFEAAAREDDAKDRSFSSTMTIFVFSALTLVFGGGLLYSIWDDCPRWLNFMGSPRSPFLYAMLSAAGVTGISSFARSKVKETEEIREHSNQKNSAIRRYLELGETKIPAELKLQYPHTAETLQWSIDQMVKKLGTEKTEK